jgi:G3E family GTPase
MNQARYIMIGGFLGAGKSTAILKLAQHLTARDRRVGLITNDQGFGLVDTVNVRASGYPVEEISGGCFCCRFNSLVEASQRLRDQTRPDVFLAEPVGSCTDLVATVSLPLRAMYGEEYAIAPLSVVVDPVRALRMLDLEAGRPFSEKVVYIYRKQLEEADIIVINKTDLVDDARLGRLRDALSERFPRAALFACSARQGTGLRPWFERIMSAPPDAAGAMEVDYGIYGAGEALLGWLNASLAVTAPEPFDGSAWLLEFAHRLHRRLREQSTEVAHLKMTLTPLEDESDIAVVNLVRNDHAPELSHELWEPLTAGELVLNLRAEASPETLRAMVESAIEERRPVTGGPVIEIAHMESFRPGQPQPTYRLGQDVAVAAHGERGGAAGWDGQGRPPAT